MIFSSSPLKRWSFQKGPRWSMIFPALSGKMVFFPKNITFFGWAGSERRPLFGWRYSTMNNLQYSVPFSLYGPCLGVCLSVDKGNYLSIRGQVVIPKMQEQRQKRFSVVVDQTFLKVHAKNLVKVTGTGEIKDRKGPPPLRKLSFKFRY